MIGSNYTNNNNNETSIYINHPIKISNISLTLFEKKIENRVRDTNHYLYLNQKFDSYCIK